MKAVIQWVLRTMMKDQTGVMRTLPKKDLVDFNVAITAERLMKNGIDPNALKNANQVENAINQVESAEKANLAENIRGGITSTKSAKVFDLEGKQIDPRSKIMGGQQAETEAEILARIKSENKKGIANIKKQKEIDDAISNDINVYSDQYINKLDQEIIDSGLYTKKEWAKLGEEVKEARRKSFDSNYADAQEGMVDPEDRALEDFVDDAGGTNPDDPRGIDDFIPDDDPEPLAQGGRAGFARGSYDRNSFEHKINELKAAYKRYKKGSSTGGRKGILTFEQFAPMFAAENFATGGIARLGFKDGMTRRTFLKLLGGMAAVPIVGKFLKPLKTAKGVTKVPMIKTDNVPGKPEWFDQLVNKVILEGDDVTKKFATGERQSIHQKTLDDGSVVRVTEDVDDGAVRVEYDSDANVFEDPVQLQYKKPLPDEGAPRPAAEFTTAESGPVGRQVGPDDFDMDVDEVGGSSIRDLDSDVSKLKEYATGKKPTMKELVQNIQRRKKARQITEDPEAQSDAIVRRQGDYDPSDYDDYAAGGIARMLGE